MTVGVETSYANLPTANGLTHDAMDEYQTVDTGAGHNAPIASNDSVIRQPSSFNGLFATNGSAMHGVVDDLD